MFRSVSWALALGALPAGNALACTPQPDPAPIEIYPSGETVPENLLRIYVYFPRPMSPRVRAADVKLFDHEGEPVEHAFLPNRYDLWSADRTRLTLLLDPGRVKTGLNAHERLGRALKSGRQYTVVVPEDLRDHQGCPLAQSVVHHYRVEAADRETPNPAVWDVHAPQVGTRQDLVIDLKSQHDHLSLAYRVRVYADDGAPVPGTLTLLDHERTWNFVPRERWRSRPYEVRIDPELEDLAGNRPGVLFDRDPESPITPWRRALTFQPRGDE